MLFGHSSLLQYLQALRDRDAPHLLFTGALQSRVVTENANRGAPRSEVRCLRAAAAWWLNEPDSQEAHVWNQRHVGGGH